MSGRAACVPSSGTAGGRGSVRWWPDQLRRRDLLLREADQRLGPPARIAQCCCGHRHPASVGRSVETLAAQRMHALALGCEDLHDHAELRAAAVLPLLVGQSDPPGGRRARARGQA